MTQHWGIAIALVYFIRSTVFPRLLHIPSSIEIAANCLVLLIVAGILIRGGGNWRWSWVMFLLVCAVSVFNAEDLKTAITRCTGLSLLMIAAGPLVLNSTAISLRTAAWRLTIQGLPILTAIFVVWFCLRLPNFGAGFFSTFMGHCMLLGPLAGMGTAIAWTRGIHEHSWHWKLVGTLGFVPVLASGSRVATLATLASVCFLLIRRKPILGLGLLAICLAGVATFVHQGRVLDGDVDSVTGALTRKGNENTRADLWACRVEEFKSSPIFGIGIAMGTGSGSVKDESGSIRVEPGSSYLAILSMTGAMGTLTFFGALVALVFHYLSSRRETSANRDILAVMGIYLAVHGIAEGWVISFGSPLCFLFWLWLGKIGDASIQPTRAAATQVLRTCRRVKPSIAIPVRG